MDMVKRILGVFLVATGLAAAVLLMATPLIHDGSADYPLWKILNWFMAAGVVVVLVTAFLGKRALGGSEADTTKRVSKKHWSELTALASGQSWRRRSMLLSSAAIPRSPCSVFGTDPAMRTSARQPNDEEVPQRCVDRMDAVPVPSPIHTRS